LIAYFDESGPHGGVSADVFTLGGFIADRQRWGRVEVTWDKLLGRRVFHAVDFHHRREEFKNWPSERRRIPLIAALADSLRGNVWAGVAHSVRYEEFGSVFCPGAREKKRLRLASGALLISCLSDLLNLRILADRVDVWSVVCEEHDGVEGFATECFHGLRIERAAGGFDDRLGTLAFYSRRQFRGLQAADLLAYENFRFCKDTLPAGTQPRKLFEALRRSEKLSAGVHEGEARRRFKARLDPLPFWQKLSGDVLAP
jgi:hypothetical protein